MFFPTTGDCVTQAYLFKNW